LRTVALAVVLLLATSVHAQPTSTRELPPGMQIPAAAQPGPDFDVNRATEAWLALLTPEQRASSDAYFEGKYWLVLWQALYSIGVMTVLLVSGASRRMRDVAERVTHGRRFLAAMLFAVMFIVASELMELPLAIYSGYFREHAYGLSNLTLPGWLREAAIGLGLSVAFGAPILALAYAGLRRAGRQWWMWATGFSLLITLFVTMLTPVVILPLFNDYKPLPEGEVREAVLKLARANEIPTQHVEWFDASRQTKRVSANVAGLFGVARINLNDNLLERTSLPEIKAVLGHEMGHYVMHHGFMLSIYLTLLAGVTFGIVAWLLERALVGWGPRLGLRDRSDLAALPLLIALYTAVSLPLTPFGNTIIRTAEIEADAFGLNAAREPQGFAMVSMRLSTYRKLRPGPAEEFIFFDHPSGYDRVRRAMLWMKENPPK